MHPFQPNIRQERPSGLSVRPDGRSRCSSSKGLGHSPRAICSPPESGAQSRGAGAPPERRPGSLRPPWQPAPAARAQTRTASACSFRRASSSPRPAPRWQWWSSRPGGLADRLQQGGTLGTDRGAKGGVLHIAAGKYSAVPAQQSGSHRKAGIGCIRKSMHGKCACHQLLVCHICFLLIVGPDLTPDALFPLLYPARPFRTRSTVQLDSAFPDSSVHFLQNQCKYILY